MKQMVLQNRLLQIFCFYWTKAHWASYFNEIGCSKKKNTRLTQKKEGANYVNFWFMLILGLGLVILAWFYIILVVYGFT